MQWNIYAIILFSKYFAAVSMLVFADSYLIERFLPGTPAGTVYPEPALNALMLEFEKALKPCDALPATICHIDLAKKNVIIDGDNLTLIDWDCVYALPWVCADVGK